MGVSVDLDRVGCGSATRDREHAPARPVVWVRQLLGRPVLGPEQQHLGHVRDVVAHRSPDAAGTVVAGLIADVGGHRWFAPAVMIRDLQSRRVVLRRSSIRPAECRLCTEHLLAQDLLGQPVMTSPDGRSTRIDDIALRPTPSAWTVWAADTRTTVQRLLGTPRRPVDWDVLVTRRFAPERPAWSGWGGEESR
jgi:hypothetical protein